MSKKGIHFNISERKILLRAVDLISTMFLLGVVSYFFEYDYFLISEKYWTWSIVLAFYIMIFGTVFELYDIQKSNKIETVIPNTILTVSIVVLLYLFTPFLTPPLPVNRLQILHFYLAIMAALISWRTFYVVFIASPRFFKKVLIIGEISNIKFIAKTFEESAPGYTIIGYVDCESKENKNINLFKDIPEYQPNKIQKIVKEQHVSEIIVASYDSETITSEIYNDLLLLLKSGVFIKEYTQVYEEVTHRLPVQFVGKDFYKYFPFSRSNQNKLYLFGHRFFDVVVSLIGLLLSVVVLPIILIGNLFGNRGPLFYTQKRVGANGEVFQIIKFRTMIINAESNGAVWSQKNDSRVTVFGKFLRRTRLDEIPQFINVLRGDMSLIGPRPERPYFVDELSKVLPFYETRHIIKPGLTGWAQVNTEYGDSVDDSLLKLQYDLFYIKHKSFFLDVNILVKTLSTVIFYRGQ